MFYGYICVIYFLRSYCYVFVSWEFDFSCNYDFVLAILFSYLSCLNLGFSIIVILCCLCFCLFWLRTAPVWISSNLFLLLHNSWYLVSIRQIFVFLFIFNWLWKKLIYAIPIFFPQGRMFKSFPDLEKKEKFVAIWFERLITVHDYNYNCLEIRLFFFKHQKVYCRCYLSYGNLVSIKEQEETL